MLAKQLLFALLAASIGEQTTASTVPGSETTLSPSRGSNSSVDECYASWNVYWSASSASVASSLYSIFNGTKVTAVATATFTTTYLFTLTAVMQATDTLRSTIMETLPVIDGGFTISTQTIDTTSTSIVTIASRPNTTETVLQTVTHYRAVSIASVVVPPTPACYLPSVVPDCQFKWESWISTQLNPSPTQPPHCDLDAGIFPRTTDSVPPCASSYSAAVKSYEALIGGTTQFLGKPICTAASISGALCQSVRDNYQRDENNAFSPTFSQTLGLPWFFNQGTIGFFNGTNGATKWIWPTTATLGVAPSCTLGCGRCAVTGGTVQLIYWPSTTPAVSSSATPSATTNSVPSTTSLVTVVTLGTTFTSPTLYISYRSVYAANACGTVGTEIGETIVAIPTNSALSSVWARAIPCDAHFRPTQELTATAPFTVADLNQPVPYSIYSSQPWCQTYIRNAGCAVSCPTTAPYEPILVVPDALLQSMQPAWSTCWGDIRGEYDPPIALTAGSSIAAPTLPHMMSSSERPYATPEALSPGRSIPGPTLPNTSPTETAQVTSSPSSGTPLNSPSAITTSVQNIIAPLGSPHNPPDTVILGTDTFTVSQVLSTDGVVVAYQGATSTIEPGGAGITLGGQVLSVPVLGGLVMSSGTAVTTVNLPGPLPQAPHAVTVIDGSATYTLSPDSAASVSNALVVDYASTTATLLPGGPAATIAGHVISIPTSNPAVAIFDSTTQTSATSIPTITQIIQTTIITVNNDVMTILYDKSLALDSNMTLHDSHSTITISPGGPAATLSSEAVHIPLSDPELLVFVSGTQTTTIALGGSSSPTTLSSGTTQPSSPSEPLSISSMNLSSGTTRTPSTSGPPSSSSPNSPQSTTQTGSASQAFALPLDPFLIASASLLVAFVHTCILL